MEDGTNSIENALNKNFIVNTQNMSRKGYKNIVNEKKKSNSSYSMDKDETRTSSSKEVNRAINKVPANKTDKNEVSHLRSNLYEVLSNINKELNVKIDKKDQSRISFSIANSFVNRDIDQEKDPDDTIGKESIQDAYTKRLSKKVDIDLILDIMSKTTENHKEPEKVADTSAELTFDKTNTNIEPQVINEQKTQIAADVIILDKSVLSPKKTENLEDLVRNEAIVFSTTDGSITSINLNKLLDIHDTNKKQFEDLLFKSQEENAVLKKEIELLKADLLLKSNIINTNEDNRRRYLKSESEVKNLQTKNLEIEKENAIMKYELTHTSRSRQNIVKRLGEGLNDMNKITNRFWEEYLNLDNN